MIIFFYEKHVSIHRPNIEIEYNKTSVESVKLGRTLELSMSLSLGQTLKYSTPCLTGIKRFMDHLILVR